MESCGPILSKDTLFQDVYNPGTDTICNMNAENFVYVELIFIYALPELVASAAGSPRVLCYSMELLQHGISHSGFLIFSRERTLHENLIKRAHKGHLSSVMVVLLIYTHLLEMSHELISPGLLAGETFTIAKTFDHQQLSVRK